ncbi:serine/threonine-protein kinase 16 [Octopus sinensis]|uniref:non-specific serine/threonine protein kinase n=1 Tax=Octopus sinensis TaxID=2607531 RepID=A0A7E6EKU9_9MOLL|nr:serine/threonine-protein kinase 16 [Octopus sinensis]XP_036355974.1 serine/threonine-protein kinase 16 [Octopus sinensis]
MPLNSFGIDLLLKMGCVCGKEMIFINNRRFYVRSSLGEGGFSLVDLIEDARSHKNFALKRIKCHSKDDENIALHEVKVMKLFKHPHIVPLIEYMLVPASKFAQNTDIYSELHIVMPYYSRGSLQDRIEMLARKGDHIHEDRLWEIFFGICEGLKAMHSHSPPYAHRDLKPANIMFADNNCPVLMDLGSSVMARTEIKTMSEARTLQDVAAERCSMQYRAPELFNVEKGSCIDERSDIWSLGCLLYALAFLESPFEQDYQRGNSIALAVLGGNIKFPENSHYSKHLEMTVQKLMAVNPMERPFIEQVCQAVSVARTDNAGHTM